MNVIKKMMGFVWMALAVFMVYFMISNAIERIGKASEATRANTTLQWVIILIIFIPCCFGLLIFGKYALQGEYDHLPESSAEITDYDQEVL
ncbi:MAG: DUF6814 family protein [Ferruginibacter sp.]